ncbi:hypothetical protein DFP87_10846 [Achromobacter marplatensis]|uniref:Uncharacterized protein n=1 Tax=Achromobacter marplatensis TaxID=470868 RepID=A0ABX9G6G6_9BURK|nr:hypothetical protein DFP87_10846 [Achromobacter marplatensis]CAB3696152.1 hypothetical protein LMG26219_05096 [Achromobacter marplatensis]
MTSFLDNVFDGVEVADEGLTCSQCGCKFSLHEFEFVDTEFDDVECRCPSCQFCADLDGHPCDYCAEPAAHALGSTFYCEEHFEDLVGD